MRALRTLAGKGDVGVFRRGGIVWELDLREGIDFAIYLQGGFEAATLREYGRIVRSGFVALDIGANIGSHTLPLAQPGWVPRVAFTPSNLPTTPSRKQQSQSFP